MHKPTVKEFEVAIESLINKIEFATVDQVRAAIFRQKKVVIDGAHVAKLCRYNLVAVPNNHFDLASYGNK